jgi:hypothetical protein
MTFLQWLGEKIERDGKIPYTIVSLPKPPDVRKKLRGKGWTRAYKRQTKARRKLAQASRRRNRR